MQASFTRSLFLLILSLSTLQSAAFANEDAFSYGQNEIDPWEKYNRAVFSFNDTLDQYIFRPVAVGYKTITPSIIDKGITNFFGNIADVVSISNSLLQAKGGQAIEMTTRVMFNTTFGLAGFFDVSTGFGLEKKKEDFGQTLAVWGVNSGPYVVLPFLGPSTIRDTTGIAVDIFLDPQFYQSDSFGVFVAKKTIWFIDLRADLLASENLIMGDKYTFLRNAYVQYRGFLINDGVVDDPFADESFDDFDDF
ncbi:MlaA family lipoprotein [Alkalimarinus alittae]|uniref:VacJ family lipoprotein n=1 Tax=Alkalimarinus alittae TaxID=2961619 RepID=A0ABY6N745_9ALTE|nr:VacJ family lipoprotein [Alkalimarinus alittae]UZE97817.1 VacJ family lipoprotein [Alkalimarinus alittae]